MGYAVRKAVLSACGISHLFSSTIFANSHSLRAKIAYYKALVFDSCCVAKRYFTEQDCRGVCIEEIYKII